MAERKYLQGEFELLIGPGKKGEPGSFPVDQFLASPLGTAPTYDFTTPYGDEISLPIPEGSFKAYVEKHKAEYSGPEPYIAFFAKYHRPPGEKTPIPPGTTAKKQSSKEAYAIDKLFEESEKRRKNG